MNLIELSILTSAFCIGFKIITDTGFILAFIGRFLTQLSDKYPILMKPVYSCHYCMGSVYSVIFYLIFMPITIKILYELPLMAVCVVCLNGMFYNLAFREWEN